VHRVLRRAGLTRYYELRRGPGLPPADVDLRRTDHKWLELIEERRRQSSTDERLHLDIQGIHCAACVWLVEELFRRHGGARRGAMSVNPALGRIELRIAPDFPLGAWVASVEELGYLLGPAKGPASENRPSDDLLLRLGICGALAANVMLFAAAIYVGLEEGPIYELLNQLSYGAGVIAFFVGGSVFIDSALRALRRRMLHLDVPIALGIVLAFAGSTWSFFGAPGQAVYVDTLTVFIALMLAGRWLQRRMLERNRAQLLDDDGSEGLLTREVRDGVVRIVHCIAIHAGDRLLIAPGDLVPVDLVIEEAAVCSLDWIDGESRPRSFPAGETVPAGAFNVGAHAFTGAASSDFASSSIIGLLGTDPAARGDGPVATRWWARVSRYYVLAVIALALAAIGWWWWNDGALRALEVGTAVLVVTCPCAFGIAAPLAYELVLHRLRRAGVFVRVSDFLDRVRGTSRIVFDKTGTLTSGMLALDDVSSLDQLAAKSITVLYNMVARSAHPKSVAVRRALEGRESARMISLAVAEHPGAGLSAKYAGHAYHLGAPAWAAPDGTAGGADVVFARDGTPLATFRTVEELRPGAADEVEALRGAGYELTILSGDAPERVWAIGPELGIEPEASIGGQSPTDKARYVQTHEPARTLLIGDGLNDRAAMEAAACSGTPAVNRPFMASRCDFYFVSPGLRAVAQVLRSSDRLAQVVRRILGFAIVYNAVAVSLALAGLMEPWLAAVLMPSSSLLTLAYTTLALSKGQGAWKF